MKRNLLRATALALGLAPTAALAHVGAGEASGFVHGFLHPLGGLDHLLAMVLLGVFAYQIGGKALVLLPLAFVSVMALGGWAGLAHVQLPFIETGIALSVVAFGLAVAFRVKLPIALAVALTGVFAVFHGYAHGAEMPMELSGAAYGAGFIAATALLHALGIGFGALVGAMSQSTNFYRAGGAAAAIVGIILLI